MIVCEQCEYFGRLPLVVLDGQVGSCCDQHVADTPTLVGGCLMERRLTAARKGGGSVDQISVEGGKVPGQSN